MVSEKRIFLCFSHRKAMGANDCWGGGILDPRGMTDRIYVQLHIKDAAHLLLKLWVFSGFREDFFMYSFSHYKPFADNDAPGAWPVWTTGKWLAGCIEWSAIHCYTQNLKLGLVVSEKIFFFLFFPL